MKKDKRTKAELLDTLDAALGRLQQADDAAAAMKYELQKAKAGKASAEAKAVTLRQSFETLRHTIKTAVAMRHPRTVAFDTVETTWYQGQLIHPGYEGDNEEVRLLWLIDTECLEALA